MPSLFRVVLRDKEDLELCNAAAKINGFFTTADWHRAIINGHLNMMGWRKLKRVDRRKLACPHGHEYTGKNTAWYMKGKYRFKVCKTCRRIRNREYERNGRKKNEVQKMRRSGIYTAKCIAS